MPRQATGSTYTTPSGGIGVRIPLAKDDRPAFLLPWCKSRKVAQVRARAMTELARRLVAAGHGAKAKHMLKKASEAGTKEALAVVADAVAILERKPATAPRPESPTFETFFRSWMSGELHKRYPDHVTDRKDFTGARSLLENHVPPHIREVPIAEFNLGHADEIMAALPSSLASGTRQKFAKTVHALLTLAVYPAQHLRAHPIPKGWVPRVKGGTALQMVYPNEDARLMAGDAPLVERLFWGVLGREGMRFSEALDLNWTCLDLERGAVRLDKNKTRDPRTWKLDPGVQRALARWHAMQGAPSKGKVFEGLDIGHPVDRFRDALQKAGARAELFVTTKERRRIRLHDLRASFVSVNLALGKSEAWIMDRTGHRTSDMLQKYRRAARNWTELNLGTFTPLDEAIPEFRGETPNETPTNRHSGTKQLVSKGRASKANSPTWTPASKASLRPLRFKLIGAPTASACRRGWRRAKGPDSSSRTRCLPRGTRNPGKPCKRRGWACIGSRNCCLGHRPKTSSNTADQPRTSAPRTTSSWARPRASCRFPGHRPGPCRRSRLPASTRVGTGSRLGNHRTAPSMPSCWT
jgi:hypothetical protein